MGRIEPTTLVLKDGSSVLIRAGAPADAAPMLRLKRHMVETSEFMVVELDELDPDLERERDILREHLDAPGKLFLVALAGKELVGELMFTTGKRRRMAHAGHFGISVARDWRGRGVGRALIRALLEWAAADPLIEKVSLGAFASNRGAIALYKSLGFIEEGVRPREFKLGPGRYEDDVRMHRFVKPPCEQ